MHAQRTFIDFCREEKIDGRRSMLSITDFFKIQFQVYRELNNREVFTYVGTD